jgi:hypothetical protein
MLEPLTPPTPDQERALLQPLAARLIWWQSPEQSLRHPDRVIAQVMELGDFDSVLQLRQVLGDHRLAAVLQGAQPQRHFGDRGTFAPAWRSCRKGNAASGQRWRLSPLDLLATKLKVLLQRAERKDDLNVATLLEAGLSLADGLAAANALDGPAFPPEEALKALVTFADGDLPELPISILRRLEAAALAVDALPPCQRSALDLSGCSPNA